MRIMTSATTTPSNSSCAPARPPSPWSSATLRIGYNRAARIIEKMEQEGVVGPSDGVKSREVLVSSFERQDPATNKAQGSKLDAGSKGN